MSAAKLLAHARHVLSTRSAGGHSARMAAFLARQALEEAVVARCVNLGAPATRANMRSRLLILRALDDPDTADAAAFAWNRLSNACHLHAYELQPSAGEIEHLCEVVAALVPA